ncbi:MAG: antibiotic biosynthesis monooxygenase family protein [Promethearchaeota archaeon]
MWVRITYGKIQPDKMDEFRKIYNEEIVPVVKKQKGIIDVYWMEDTEVLGDGISLTSWDTKENGEIYESSGTYQEMVNKVKHTFVEPPTLKSFEVKR